jgi:phage terminase large subunit-like protein
MSIKVYIATDPKHPVEIYVRDVIAGRIVASKLVRLACERHLRDLSDGHKRGLRFDPVSAQRAVDFFQFLKHSKGEWAGQSFELSPWQQFIVYSIFGWKKADGTRRFRVAHVEVARKNGKTTLWAGVGLYLFFADGEPGAEVYCAATKKDQARILFNEAERMRKASPSLKKRILSFKDNMNVPATNSKFEPLGSDEDTLDGLNPHGALVDELHAHKDRGLWDVLDTATGSRRQSLLAAITTAGFNRESVCYRQNEYGQKVLDQVIDDDSFFVYVACLDQGDDWEDERNWPKANPGLGVSVKLESLRVQANKAKNDPAALNAFLRLRLNVWTQQNTRWMPIEAWNECVGFSMAGIDAKVLRAQVLEQLAGKVCYAGLDLSSKIDLTAYVKLFPPTEEIPKFIAVCRFYMPEDNVARRVKEDRVPYDVWIREGFITATPGNVVDYDWIKGDILRDAKAFELRELAFDPYNATQTAIQLKNEGIQTVEFRQGFLSMSEPTKELMKIVLQKKLAHLSDPVLRWNAANVVVKQDEAGNLKLNKDKSPEKIDGLVALVMALGRAIANPGESGESVYETRGILTL